MQAGHLRRHFHCYALDFPDQGKSSPAPAGGNLFEYYTAAAKAFLEHYAPGGAVSVHPPILQYYCARRSVTDWTEQAAVGCRLYSFRTLFRRSDSTAG